VGTRINTKKGRNKGCRGKLFCLALMPLTVWQIGQPQGECRRKVSMMLLLPVLVWRVLR
jgi:hypothetical protein